MQQLHAYGFGHPLKDELERLLTIQEDLRRCIDCLQLLVPPASILMKAGSIGMALHTQALVSYMRCFASGRRKGLSSSIYNADGELAARHIAIKTLRDKHVAHAVGEDEHCSVLVAAKDVSSPAIGLGVRYWFFAGGDDKHMVGFLKLAEFAQKIVRSQIQVNGDLLAKQVVGPRATWKGVQKAFRQRVSDEELYPTKP